MRISDWSSRVLFRSAGGRRPGGGARQGRRARPRCRLLRPHRPQALWADRHRRALWQGRAPEVDAALPRRRHMIRVVSFAKTTYAEPPHRFEAGTPPIVEAIGLGAAIDYVNAIGQDAIAAHEAGLLAYATKRLSQVEGLTIFGTAREKASIISFAPDEIGRAPVCTPVTNAH